MYAVFAVYSTGYSFSRNDGEYMELVSFHKNKKLALENQATLEGFNKTAHEGGPGCTGVKSEISPRGWCRRFLRGSLVNPNP